MDDTTSRRLKFLINLAYAASLFGIAFIVLRYGLGMAMPFLIALLISSIAQPLISLLHDKLRIKHSIASILSVLFVFFTLGWLSVIVISGVGHQISSLYEKWPEFYRQFSEQAANYLERLADLFTLLPPYAAEYVENAVYGLLDALPSAMASLTVPILSFVTGAASKLPSIFVASLVTIAASILISADYEEVRRFITLQMPSSFHSAALDTKQFFKLTVFRLLQAYAAICFITFIELNIGFALLGVKNGLLLSTVIALVDILPIFGCGGVLIPWSILCVVFQDYGLAIGLALLYLFISSMRQVIEPKVVGTRIGLNPVASLLAIYCGLKFFGVLGMFILPVVLIVLKHMQDSGYVKLWNKRPLRGVKSYKDNTGG